MSYATDGKCHNAEPGSYGHECNKPARWIGVYATGYRCGFCDACRKHGSEARGVKQWLSYDQTAEVIRQVIERHKDTRGIVDEVAMRALFTALDLPLAARLTVWRAVTAT